MLMSALHTCLQIYLQTAVGQEVIIWIGENATGERVRTPFSIDVMALIQSGVPHGYFIYFIFKVGDDRSSTISSGLDVK